MKKRLFCVLLIAVLIISMAAVPAYAVESSADNERYIYTYLTNEMGLNTAAACGIMANIYYETNFTADISVRGFYGLFMYWSGLTQELVNWCAKNGEDHTTVEGQMEFFHWKVENHYKSMMETFRGLSNTAESAYTAGSLFCSTFERPGNLAYECNKRGGYASGTLFPRYANANGTDTPNALPEVKVDYTAYVTASALNVRTGPHSSYMVTKSIPRGTEVRIVAEVGTWGELSTGGWVSKTYLSTTAPGGTTTTTPPETTTPAPAPETGSTTPEPEDTPVVETPVQPDSSGAEEGARYTVTASALNVRNSPSIYSTVARYLVRNETVVVVDEATDNTGAIWCELSTGGWVSKTYLSGSGNSSVSTGHTYTVNASGLNIRNGAGTNYTVINSLWRGATVTIVNTAYDAAGQTWGQLSYGGWVSMAYLK